ncbi:MAG TPA: hypothetical protein VFV33_00145 [Gemmatimonadaceae bacterium]|nr:hypothetical protein [Gemmatimonadaceae bacterium]
MAIEIVAFTPEWEPAVRRFNQRMREGHAPSAFLLPERAGTPRSGLVRAVQYIARDGEEVRGGIIVREHPAYLDGRTTDGGGARRETVVNLQSPLSEGIVDSRHAMVAIQLIRFAVKRCPYAYVVGMGGMDRPLPRLLVASGWTVRPVPFFFRILRASRALRQLQPLQRDWKLRLAATAAAYTGSGALALAVLQRTRATTDALRVEAVTEVTDAGRLADDATWRAIEPRLSFGVVRDGETLPDYLWAQTSRHRAYRGRQCVGWFSLMISAMRGHSYFGDLKVATLVDVAAADARDTASLALCALEQARAAGCDLVVSNQLHREGQAALRRAGFLTFRSNYLLATSKALSAVMQDETSLVSRQDGDGLVNLRER